MTKKSTAPYVVRWRDALLADGHPALTWRAITAAMALTIYADVKTGHNCYPGKAACATKMRVSEQTIQRGWDELVKAGWLKIHPLPEERRRTQGALKELRFPRRDDLVPDSTRVLSDVDPVPDRYPTIPGNQGGLPTSSEPAEAGELECFECGRMTSWTVRGKCGDCVAAETAEGRP